MFAAVILYIATLCYGLAHLANPVNCRNVSFLVTEIINLAISIMFLGIGYQIDKNARSQVQDRLKQAQADFDFSSEKSAKQTLEVAKLAQTAVTNSLSNMWIIIITLGVTNLIVYVYSQILYIHFGNTEHCNLTDSIFVENFTNTTERLI